MSAKVLAVHCPGSLGNMKELSDRGQEKGIASFYLLIASNSIPCLFSVLDCSIPETISADQNIG